jgi:hypothetical protein
VSGYRVDYSRVLAGAQHTFDEQPYRDLARREVKRGRDIAACGTNDIIPDPVARLVVAVPARFGCHASYLELEGAWGAEPASGVVSTYLIS